jgi:hypothetical protein
VTSRPLRVIVPATLVAAITVSPFTTSQMDVGIARGQATVKMNLPSGWRLPKREEETFSADDWRSRDRDRFLVVRADFDGDGKEDEARLLVSSDGTKHGLFVFLASGAPIRLFEGDARMLKAMGIHMLEPGTHETACGKGYWDCEPGEPKALELRNPGLVYFKEESAASVFFWSPTTRDFQRIWLSD